MQDEEPIFPRRRARSLSEQPVNGTADGLEQQQPPHSLCPPPRTHTHPHTLPHHGRTARTPPSLHLSPIFGDLTAEGSGCSGHHEEAFCQRRAGQRREPLAAARAARTLVSAGARMAPSR